MSKMIVGDKFSGVEVTMLLAAIGYSCGLCALGLASDAL